MWSNTSQSIKPRCYLLFYNSEFEFELIIKTIVTDWDTHARTYVFFFAYYRGVAISPRPLSPLKNSGLYWSQEILCIISVCIKHKVGKKNTGLGFNHIAGCRHYGFKGYCSPVHGDPITVECCKCRLHGKLPLQQRLPLKRKEYIWKRSMWHCYESDTLILVSKLTTKCKYDHFGHLKMSICPLTWGELLW